jgi:hypothetical protein
MTENRLDDDPLMDDDPLTAEIAKFKDITSPTMTAREWLSNFDIFGNKLKLLSDNCIIYIIHMAHQYRNRHISAIIIGVLMGDTTYINDPMFKSSRYLSFTTPKIKVRYRFRKTGPPKKESVAKATLRNRYKTLAIHLKVAVNFALQLGSLLGDYGTYLLVSVINYYLSLERFKATLTIKTFIENYPYENLLIYRYTTND